MINLCFKLLLIFYIYKFCFWIQKKENSKRYIDELLYIYGLVTRYGPQTCQLPAQGQLVSEMMKFFWKWLR